MAYVRARVWIFSFLRLLLLSCIMAAAVLYHVMLPAALPSSFEHAGIGDIACRRQLLHHAG